MAISLPDHGLGSEISRILGIDDIKRLELVIDWGRGQIPTLYTESYVDGETIKKLFFLVRLQDGELEWQEDTPKEKQDGGRDENTVG